MAISKDRQKALTGVLDKINKKFGVDSVAFVKDIQDRLRVEFYPTPSHEFNIMTNGGFGKGRIVELYGENSSGKTSMAIETIAKNQKTDPEFVAGWFETEGSVDPDQLKMFGVDMSRLSLLGPDGSGCRARVRHLAFFGCLWAVQYDRRELCCRTSSSCRSRG